MSWLMDNQKTNMAYAAGAAGMIYALMNWRWDLFAMTLIIHFCLITIFSAVIHRYYSHKAFKANGDLMWLLAAITTSYSYASPINWTYLHLAHHRYADTDKDSHIKGLRGLLSASYRLPDKKFLVASRWFTDRKHLLLHNYASVFVIGVGIISWVISVDFFVWGFLLPIFLLHFTQGFHKTFSHDGKNATNRWWMEFFLPMGGEWVHLVHHQEPGDPKFSRRWFEFDPGWLLSRLLMKSA